VTYHLFLYSEARGGIHDFDSVYTSVEQAEGYIRQYKREDFAHIATYDAEKGKWEIVREYMYSRMDVDHPSSLYYMAWKPYRWLWRVYEGLDAKWKEL